MSFNKKILIFITLDFFEYSDSRDSFLYDKNTLAKRSREKTQKRLGIIDDHEIYYSHTKQKELADIAQCTFRPNIYQNPKLKEKDLNATQRTESKEALFRRLHEVKKTNKIFHLIL